ASQAEDVRVGLVAIISIPAEPLLLRRIAAAGLAGVEAVARAVQSDVAEFATRNRIQQGLLALGRHLGTAVLADAHEVTGRVEQHRIELLQVIGSKLAPVLAEGKRKPVFGAELLQDFLRVTRTAIDVLDDLVFVTGRLREKQDALRRFGPRNPRNEGNDSSGKEEGSEVTQIHAPLR